jgi:uncharacterized protein YjbI with pentapeptide repeats
MSNVSNSISIGGSAFQSQIISGDNNQVSLNIYYQIQQEKHIEGANPYKGLDSFQEQDADWFFGRNQDIESLWQNLRTLLESPKATRLLPIYGPSGSGKSSLARAGLLPELARRPIPAFDRLQIAVLTPGRKPLNSLATVLERMAIEGKAQELLKPLNEDFQDGNPPNIETVQSFAECLLNIQRSPLLIFVDQFEEIFTQCKSVAEGQNFVQNLLYAAAHDSEKVVVILTLRSDFLGQTQQFPVLNQLISKQGFFVSALSPGGLRDAICEPAKLAGHPLDESTVQLLIQDTEGRDGSLPLLQFALQRIWVGLKKGIEPGQTLTEIGGVGGALGDKADAIYKSFSSDAKKQDIVRSLFLGLIKVGENLQNDTRIRRSISELSQDNEVELIAILERFADRDCRLITLSTSSLAEDSTSRTAEITHEALIRNWGQLKSWLNSERKLLLLRQQIEFKAHDWVIENCTRYKLLEGHELSEAKKFNKLHQKDLPLSLTARNLIKVSLRFQLANRMAIASIFFGTALPFYNWAASEVQSYYALKQHWDIVRLAELDQPISPESLRSALEEINRSHKSLEKVQLPKKNLDGINLQKANLREANLSFALLQGSDLLQANLQGINVSNANLYQARLREVDASRAYMIIGFNPSGSGSNFSNSNLEEINLIQANLDYANFDNAVLTGARLTSSKLSHTSFHKANLRWAILEESNLSWSSLSNADLFGAYLTNADFRDAIGLDATQIKRACNWEQASYDEEFRQKLINSPSPVQKPDCKYWETGEGRLLRLLP